MLPTPWITEKYLGHGWSRSLLTYQTLSALLFQQLQCSSIPFHYPLMAFFNQNNFDFVPSAPEEFDSDPFLWRQMLATEERVHRHAAPALADRWTMVDQPGFVTGPSTSVPTTTNYSEYISILPIDLCLMFEPICSVPSTIGSYPAPSHGSHWPTIDQSAQLDYPSTLSRDNFFQSRQGWGTAVSAPTPNPSKTPASRVQDLDTYSLTVATDSRGSRQYGVPTNVSYTVSNQGLSFSHTSR